MTYDIKIIYTTTVTAEEPTEFLWKDMTPFQIGGILISGVWLSPDYVGMYENGKMCGTFYKLNCMCLIRSPVHKCNPLKEYLRMDPRKDVYFTYKDNILTGKFRVYLDGLMVTGSFDRNGKKTCNLINWDDDVPVSKMKLVDGKLHGWGVDYIKNTKILFSRGKPKYTIEYDDKWNPRSIYYHGPSPIINFAVNFTSILILPLIRPL